MRPPGPGSRIMILRQRLAFVFCLSVVVAVLSWPQPALAQRTQFANLRQCERYAAQQLRARDPFFRRFVIERSSVKADKYADYIGRQFVSTVYYGRAILETGIKSERVRFICLSGGHQDKPVFVHIMTD